MNTNKIKIGDLCQLKYGDSLPERSRVEGHVPVYGSNGIVGCHQNGITRGETIIVGRKGSVGKIQFSANECFPIDTTYYIDETSLPCNLKWLYYNLLSQNLSRFNKAAAVPGINRNDVYEISINYPDLQTQKQIAQVLEDADRARQQRKAANALTEQFLQSSFLHLFGDPVMNEKGWDFVRIRDIASEVKYGTSKPAESDGLYPYLRMNNITYDGKWNFSNLKFISLEENEKEKYLLKRGDLVFNRTNSKELVGKTAVYNRNDEMAIAGYLIRVRLTNKAVPEYVSAFLNSSYGKELLKAMCKNIIGMANINAQELQNISLQLPPLSLQQHFASLVADAEILHQKQQQSERELEHLFQALLQRYLGRVRPPPC